MSVEGFPEGSVHLSRAGSAYHSHRSEASIYQDIGNFKLHVVSEDTRAAVNKKIKRLDDKLQVENARIRKHFEDKFDNRIRVKHFLSFVTILVHLLFELNYFSCMNENESQP